MNTNAQLLREYAAKYNDPVYFQEDPIAFPTRFADQMRRGECNLADVEIAAVISAHLAWGRRAMIVRDCGRAFDEMGWKPYDYVMKGEYRCEPCSLHRTVMWSEFAAICSALREFYLEIVARATETPPTKKSICCAGGWCAATARSTLDSG